MPQLDVKKLSSQLKNNEISNIYYLYGLNINGTENLTKRLVKKIIGDAGDYALTKIDGKNINIPEFRDNIELMPMICDYNCILINDYNCDEQKDDTTKQLIATLKDIPSYTVVIFNITGFDAKGGKKKVTPKNKKLVDYITKAGVVCEQDIPSIDELVKIIENRAINNGSKISWKCAKILAEMCLSDTLAINNEVDKLCAYANGAEITFDMIEHLVAKQTDMNVYKLANAICTFNKKTAFEALNKLMEQKSNRGIIVATISNSFIDLYRAVIARNSGKQADEIAKDYEYIWDFVIKNAMRDSRGVSVKRLRKCISILRDTATTLNSTGTDEKVVLELAVTKMLLVNDR